MSRLGQGAAEGQKEASLSPVTLRDGGDAVSQSLLSEIRKRTEPIGIAVDEAHISHLAYSFEIAGIMLTKQAASAVVAARRLVVKGAVSIPCSDRSASPAPSRRETVCQSRRQITRRQRFREKTASKYFQKSNKTDDDKHRSYQYRNHSHVGTICIFRLKSKQEKTRLFIPFFKSTLNSLDELQNTSRCGATGKLRSASPDPDVCVYFCRDCA